MSDNINDPWGVPTTAKTTTDSAWGENGGTKATNGDGDGGDGDGPSGSTGDAGSDAGDNACFNCGKPGHNKADCPDPHVFSGTCRTCNEEGHMSKDCPQAGPMMCRRCGEEGHMVKDCPQPLICNNCGEEDHTANDCKSARKVDRSGYADVEAGAAFDMIIKGIAERDLDDVKEAVQTYVKANPDVAYFQLEEEFRAKALSLWLIALEKPLLAATLTNMDLQGNLDKKYTVTYRFDPNPPRPREREIWPKSTEENMERLKDAGEVVNRGISKCSNCNELGHVAKNCPEERQEPQTVTTIKCYNCDSEGHRVRDCPVPRVDRFACKNCGKSDHKVADCPEPRSAADVECRKCNEIGHFSKDCPKAGPRGCRNCGEEGHMAKDCTEPRNMANFQCRNCDEFGHGAKECPKPRDMARVKCSHCQEMGHWKSKCPNPIKEDDADGNFGNNDGGALEVNTGGATADGGDTWGAAPSSDPNTAW